MQYSIRALSQIGRIGQTSFAYKSTAWPDPTDPPFVNAVASMETDLSPLRLLEAIHGVEAAFGRQRSGAPRNSPRTLDIDILAYHDEVELEGAPVLPHPRMAERPFVLKPAFDIAPDWRHPVSGRSIAEMLAAIDASDVHPIGPID